MNNFVCSQCKTEFEVPYKFCKECGGIVEEKQITSNRFCPQCGKEMQSGARFCSFCGGKAKSSSVKTVLILVIAIAFGLGCGIAYMLLTSKTVKNVEKNVEKNVINGAIAKNDLESILEYKFGSCSRCDHETRIKLKLSCNLQEYELRMWKKNLERSPFNVTDLTKPFAIVEIECKKRSCTFNITAIPNFKYDKGKGKYVFDVDNQPLYDFLR